MENYFNYFTEIEEHFQKRRESLRLLSPLDWALIESFQEARVPLEVVLRGIDLAFERHAKRKSKAQKVNSLSYCTQAILREFERLQENSVGKGRRAEVQTKREQNDRESLAEMIDRSAGQLESRPRPSEERRAIFASRPVRTHSKLAGFNEAGSPWIG